MAAPVSSMRSLPSALFGTLIISTVLTNLSTAAPWSHGQLLASREREETARAWAPLVWLHPHEHFYPDDVHTFLRHVHPSPPGWGPPITVKDGSTTIKLPSLPEGKDSWDAYLLAHFDQECTSNCHLPKFMYGMKPTPSSSPPVYAVIHSCQSSSPKISRRMAVSTEESIFSDNNSSGDAHTPTRSTEQDVPLPATYLTPPPPPFSNAPTPGRSSTNATEVPLQTSPKPHGEMIESDLNSPHANVDSAGDIGETDYHITEYSNNHKQNTTQTPSRLQNSTTDDYGRDQSKQPDDDYTMDLDSYISSTEDPDWNPVSSNEDDQFTDEPKATPRKRNVDDQGQLFTVTYWMFYPYNYGKDTCTLNLGYYFGRMFKPKVNGTCYGEEVAMGNHVGDWEHVSIQFKGDQPINMYVSTHDFGAFYKYDRQQRLFTYSHEDTRKGIPMSPDYPSIVSLHDSRPVLYSTLGSHGLWAAPGSHQYSSFPKLIDVTGKGTEWRTWLNMDVIDLKDRLALTRPHRRWMAYEGRWGNPKHRCHTLMAGFCELSQGPTGIPRKRINFPCPRYS